MSVAKKLTQMTKRAASLRAKQAGFYSEWASGFNPLNSIGGPVGTILAGLTPTRDLGEQAETDESMWKNLLIPGVGPYNAMKRLGTAIRGPELRSERRDLAEHRDEARKALRDRRLQPRDGDGDGKVNDGTPEEKEARAKQAGIGTMLGGGAGIGLNRLMGGLNPEVRNAILGALITGAGGGLAGALTAGEDEEDQLRGLIRGGILGAGIGGVGGYAYGANKPKPPGEMTPLSEPKSIFDRLKHDHPDWYSEVS